MQQSRPLITIIFCVLLLCILSFGAYHNILTFFYTDVDTFDLIWYGRLSSFTDILRIFASNVGGGPHFYRPISQLSFAIDNAVWGDNPFGYHLTDLGIHTLNALLLFSLALFLLPPSKYRYVYAFTAAGLFAISPANLAVVSSITNRHDSIAAFFSLICLAAASRAILHQEKKPLLYTLSLIAGALAIFAKESAYVLPLLLGLLCLICMPQNWTARIKEALKWSIPLAVLVLFNVWLHTLITGRMPSMAPTAYARIKAGIMYAIFLLQPADVSEVNIYWKTILLIILALVLGVSLVFIRINIRKAVIDSHDTDLLRICCWLLLLIACYGIIYVSFGQFGHRYAYVPTAAYSLFLICLVLYRGRNIYIRWLRRTIVFALMVYTILCSPLIWHYKAWERSSQVSRIIVSGIEDAISRYLADKPQPTVYLVNLPVFLEYKSGFMNESAAVLRDYNLDAWAKMRELRNKSHVSIKTISHIRMYESPQEKAAIDYEAGDKTILMRVRNITIPLTGFGKLVGTPLVLGFRENQPELQFNRSFKENEVLLLFDGKEVKTYDWRWVAERVYPYPEKSLTPQ